MEVILKHKAVDYWSKVTKYKGCFSYIASYWTRSGSRYNTKLSNEELAELEIKLGYAKDTLAKHSKFWDTFAIKLGEAPLVLNTDNPYDYFKYVFLKDHKDVALGLLDKKPSTLYVMINKDDEAKEANNFNKVKIDSIVEYKKMSMDDMRKCLRLFGQKSDNISGELVEATLFNIIEKEPQKFFQKWVYNKVRNTEYLIEAAVAKNVLRKNKNVYYYGTDAIGNSLSDAIAYLDNPKNQDLKITILSELESK